MVKSFSSREIITMLERDGWRLVRTRSDHRAYKHPRKAEIVTVGQRHSNRNVAQHIPVRGVDVASSVTG